MTVALRDGAEVVDHDLRSLAEHLDVQFRGMDGKHLLITGGAGFLGYYMVQAPLMWNDLAGGGIHVSVYDNFFRGVPAWLKTLEGRNDLELIVHDVRDPLPEAAAPYAYVVHAAGIASPTFYRAHPLETMDANVGGLRHLLERAAAQIAQGDAMRGLLFFSSSEVYGDPSPEEVPTAETYKGNVSCTGPRACYDESKRYGETLCVVFAQTRGVPIVMARPFNNYGPGMKITDGRALPDFCRAVIENRDIVLFSDGTPTRTFCYASDAVEGYFRLLVGGRPGEPYNIGTEEPEISMAALADLIRGLGAEIFGYSGRVVLGRSSDEAYLIDNPNRRCPDIRKARAEVGYEPRVALQDGLRRTLTWYGDNRWGEEK